MNPKHTLIPTLLAVTLAVCAVPASAAGSIAYVDIRMAEPAGAIGERYATLQSNGLSLSEAVERVRRQYDGRIISAETRRSGNREVHVIKVLTRDNKVKTVRINGRRLGNRRS